MSSNFSKLIESAELCGEILAKCRAKANLSRRELSEKIGYSESTIKAWESGDGSPTLSVMLQWFDVTGCNMFRSLLDFLWPEAFLSLNAGSSDEAFRKAISLYLNEIAGELEIKRLYHMIFHGSANSWIGLLELFCAYAHLTLLKRHHIVEINSIAYEIASANNTLKVFPFADPQHILVAAAKRSAKTSVLNNSSGYMIGFYDLSVTDVTAAILKNSRTDSDISQKHMAMAIRKSEHTIQNWETNIQPTFLELNTWFDILGKNIWFYLRNALNPYEEICISEDSAQLRGELVSHFSSASSKELRMISYLIFGEYGSYWNAVLEMMFEHISLPLDTRVLIVRSIVTGYEADINSSTLQCSSHILPELNSLEAYVAALVNEAKSCQP